LLVHPPAPSLEVATIVALDTSSWRQQGVWMEGVAAEVAVPGEQPSHPVVCRMELHSGERGTGAVLACAETTITSQDGWVKLRATIPPERERRRREPGWALRYLLRHQPPVEAAKKWWPSLLFITRMAEGSENAYYARATFRNVRIHTRA
jgi:hypothetical protein